MSIDERAARVWELPPETEVRKRLGEECLANRCGDQGKCRWLFSELSGINGFRLEEDALLAALADWFSAEVSPSSRVFFRDASRFPFSAINSYLLIHRSISGAPKMVKLLKMQTLAVVILLQHPDWTDERIARKVGTQTHTLQRYAYFKRLRGCQTSPDGAPQEYG